jgi:hypothetical protein
MSARTLAAAAALTAALAGPASAQMPPMPLPLGGGGMGAGPMPGPMPPGPMPGPEYAPPGMGYPAGGCPPGFPEGTLDGVGQIRGPKAWLGVEYLVYWTKNAPTGTLATTGPAAGFAVLGAAGTSVAFGDNEFDFREQHGLRLHGGFWVTDSIAVEGSVFYLPSKDQSLGPVVGAPGTTLARPFFDSNLRAQNVRLLSRPGVFTGQISADASLGLWGAEIGGVLRAIDNGKRVTIDGMLGFKHVSLEESLTINDSATALAGGVANFNGVGYRTGATTLAQDYFSTENRIYGVMLGSRFNLHLDAFTLSLTSKVTLGVNEQTVKADGSTHLTGPFPAATKVGGGLYAVGPNVGKFSRSEFAYVPELNLNLTAQLTPHLTLSLGYNFLYIGEVVRPGDQLTSPINPVFVPTSASFGGRFGQQVPAPVFNTSSFWANGINLGLTCSY